MRMAVMLLSAAALRAGAQNPLPAPTFTLRSAHEVTAGASTALNVIISVVNPGATPLRVAPAVRLPTRWRVLAGGDSFTVASRAHDVWLLTVAAAPRAVAGRYIVGISARAAATSWSDSVIITVPDHIAADVQLVSSDEYGGMGRPLVLEYLIHNSGNAPAAFDIEAQSGMPGDLRWQPSHVSLAVNDSARVRVSVGAPPQIRRATARPVTLTVSSAGHIAKTVDGEVLFVPSVIEDSSVSLPLSVTLRTTRDGRGVSPVFLTSHSALGTHGDWRVDLDARGPGPRLSQFGEQDYYALDVRGPGARVRVGDLVPEQSRLTGTAWQQLGASVELRPGPFVLSGFGTQDRYSAQRGGALGGSLGVSLPHDASFALNDVVYRGPLVRDGNAASATASVRLIGDMRLSGEAAAGTDSTRPLAGQVRLAARNKWFWYDGQLLRADSAYPGPMRGTRLDAASGGITLGRWFGVHASLIDYSITRSPVPTVDDVLSGAIRRSLLFRNVDRTAGVSFDGLLTVDGERREAVGGQTDELVRASASVNMGRLSTFFTGEAGQRTLPTGEQFARERGLVSLTVRAGGLNLNSFVDYSTDAYELTHTRQGRRMSAGVNTVATLGKHLTARLVGVGSGSAMGGGSWDSTSLYFVDGSITARANTLQAISLHVRAQRSTFQWFPDRTLVLLEYEFPLGVRLGSSERATVTGRVVDETSGRPVPNMLVRVGDAVAITDDNGRVEFPSMKAGTYALVVDAGHSDRAGARAPREITVNGDRPTEFRVAVFPSTHSRIVVRHLAPAETPIGARRVDSLVVVGVVPAVTVTLISDRDTLRRVVSNGMLDLGSQLHPGKWIARIDSADVPAGFVPGSPPVKFELVARGDATVSLDLIERQRTARVLPGGEIRVVPNTPPPINLARLTGTYVSDRPPLSIEVTLRNGALRLTRPGQPAYTLTAETNTRFIVSGASVLSGAVVEFTLENGIAKTLTLIQQNDRVTLRRW
jgi:hypothetical protein